MLLIPSIDLRGGHCVRLLKGDFDAETRYDSRSASNCSSATATPALRWLHVVDLDGARDGTPGNRELIARAGRAARLRIQLAAACASRDVVDDAAGRTASRAS